MANTLGVQFITERKITGTQKEHPHRRMILF